MIKVLIVGNGAREHVLAETIIRSPQDTEIYAFMGAKNPGIAKFASKFEIGKVTDADAIVKFAADNNVSFAIIGPEAPLQAGVVDALEKAGVGCVGPKKKLAQLETNKSFARDLLTKFDIPGNPKYKVFTSMDGIKEFMDELGSQFVVKAEGLRGGKGVKLTGEHLKDINEALEYCKQCIKEDGLVVVEEKLEGEEFSLQCFADGKHVVATPPVQDHKRAYEDDKGPNTGGMGSYSCSNHVLPFLRKEDIDDGLEITQKVCEAIKEECGQEYKGIMYGGFMVTKDGVKLIEYNARFGDPEAMNVLPILKTDFVEVCKAIIDGTLDQLELDFAGKATVCKYAVPEGYPDNPQKGEKVDVSGVGDDAKLYFASVDEKEDGLYMSGSRAIAFVGIGEDLGVAEKIAQNAVEKVKGPIFFRKDIGTEALIDKRKKHMQEIRG